MDCTPVDWWLEVGRNVVLWALIGYWWAAVRRIRRLERELAADRLASEGSQRGSREGSRP